MNGFIYYGQLALEALIGVFGLRAYEEPAFRVTEQLGGAVEIRRYEPRVAAQVRVPESGGAGGERAFPLLFAYIAGANRASGEDGSGERVAMTMPVEVAAASRKVAMTIPVETAAEDGGVRMRFFLPSTLTAATAPRPSDPRVQILEVPQEDVAVLRFSGSPDEAEIARRRAELTQVLASSRWVPQGEPAVLFYDAPFTLPFVRRNEVGVRVVAAQP